GAPHLPQAHRRGGGPPGGGGRAGPPPLPPPPAPAAPPAKVYPANVLIYAKEFYFTVSRRTVPAGPVSIQFANYGEDTHDLRLQRVGGAHIAGTPVVQPGDVVTLSAKLLPGRYLLWCRIANH